jgi:GGDEF domain-containing protein
MVVFAHESFTANDVPNLHLLQIWDDASLANCEIRGFWIASSWIGNRDALINHIRHSQWWDYCIFTEEAIDHPLCDGAVSLEEAIKRSERFALLRSEIKFDFNRLSPREKLLTFLYTRKDYLLVPLFDRHAQTLYVYPTVEWLSDGTNSSEWFEELIRQNFLSHIALVDRVRLCRKCLGAHLYFVDTCPSCSSIDIRQENVLHCFTCGFVAVKNTFETHDGLECPKCNARLRHIGVDYDIPVAQYACAACNQLFVEPSVIAKCMDCGTNDDPEKLDIKEIFTISLSHYGREAILKGRLELTFSAFDALSHRTDDLYFKAMLNWSLAAQRRYPEMTLALALIRITNLNEILDVSGERVLSNMLQEFASRLKEILRDTDLVYRDSEQYLWLFLPFTKIKGIEQRLRALFVEVQPLEGVGLTFVMSIVYSFEEKWLDQNADSVMSDLITTL